MTRVSHIVTNRFERKNTPSLLLSPGLSMDANFEVIVSADNSCSGKDQQGKTRIGIRRWLRANVEVHSCRLSRGTVERSRDGLRYCCG